MSRVRKSKKSGFVTGKFRLGRVGELDKLTAEARGGKKAGVADGWASFDPDAVVRHPICPYGCDEEGQLVEVIQTKDSGTVGVYKDSGGLIFTSAIAAKPKPNERRIVIGPDGEPTIVSGEDV